MVVWKSVRHSVDRTRMKFCAPYWRTLVNNDAEQRRGTQVYTLECLNAVWTTTTSIPKCGTSRNTHTHEFKEFWLRSFGNHKTSDNSCQTDCRRHARMCMPLEVYNIHGSRMVRVWRRLNRQTKRFIINFTSALQRDNRRSSGQTSVESRRKRLSLTSQRRRHCFQFVLRSSCPLSPPTRYYNVRVLCVCRTLHGSMSGI